MINFWKYIGFGAFLLLSAQQAMATGQIDKKAGWGVKIFLNVGYVSDQSQFDTDSDNAVTPDLESSGEKITDTGFFPLARLDYTLSSLKTQFFIGQARENIVRGLFQYEVGVAHMLGEKALLEVAYSPDVLNSNKTWEDPYVTGIARVKTDQSGRCSPLLRVCHHQRQIVFVVTIILIFASALIEQPDHSRWGQACQPL